MTTPRPTTEREFRSGESAALIAPEIRMERIAKALEALASQSEQQTALIASLAESSRILCDAVERVQASGEY